MITENSTPEYIILFRGTDYQKGLSPEQLQDMFGKFGQWFDSLSQQGKLKGGQPLEPTGKIISGPKGRIVADGPFAESKETIGGYFILTVDTMDEAVEIAQSCPTLDHGGTVEVRQIASECPHAKLAGKRELAEAAV